MNIQPFKWKLKTSAKGGPVSKEALHQALGFMHAHDVRKVFLFRLPTHVDYGADPEGFGFIEPFGAITRE